MKQTPERRAVRIAAVVMQRDGLCRNEGGRCGRAWPPEEADCVKCIERWLLSRAKKELKKEGNR